MLMDRDSEMIRDISSATRPNLGQESNLTSGKAILALQNQGGVVTAELFDNLRYAIQLQGELQLSLVEQFYSEEKVIRLTGSKGKIDWVNINTPEVDPATGEVRYLNDITASQDDFVVDEQDYSASLRQSMFETMMKLLSSLPPDISVQMLDLGFELSDIPGRDEIVSRIRKINGQVDPNAKLSPEDAQAQEKATAERDKQKALKDQAVMLDLQSKQVALEQQKIQLGQAQKQIAMEAQGNPEADQAKQELQQFQQAVQVKASEVAQQIQQLQKQLDEQGQQAHEEIMSLEQQLQAAQSQLKDKSMELINEQARIAEDAHTAELVAQSKSEDAAAKIRVEEIRANAQE